MATPTRRELLTAAAILPLAGALVLGSHSAQPKEMEFTPPVPGRDKVRRRYFPDVVLTTHEGRRVRFYDDLLKDKIVVLSLMYANCQGVCPKITANLVKARTFLPEAARRQLSFYSITVKPEEDTPAKLREYAERHGTGPGWLFLTGDPKDIELLRRKLGYVDIDPEVDKDRSRHSGMVRFGNEPRAQWAACQGQANPRWIAKELSFVIPGAISGEPAPAQETRI